jgi:hypothetical protein
LGLRDIFERAVTSAFWRKRILEDLQTQRFSMTHASSKEVVTASYWPIMRRPNMRLEVSCRDSEIEKVIGDSQFFNPYNGRIDVRVTRLLNVPTAAKADLPTWKRLIRR